MICKTYCGRRSECRASGSKNSGTRQWSATSAKTQRVDGRRQSSEWPYSLLRPVLLLRTSTVLLYRRDIKLGVVFKKIIRLVQFVFRMTAYRPSIVSTLVCMLGLGASCSYALLFCHVYYSPASRNELVTYTQSPTLFWLERLGVVCQKGNPQFDLNRIQSVHLSKSTLHMGVSAVPCAIVTPFRRKSAI
jgi:hypothetical protein